MEHQPDTSSPHSGLVYLLSFDCCIIRSGKRKEIKIKIAVDQMHKCKSRRPRHQASKPGNDANCIFLLLIVVLKSKVTKKMECFDFKVDGWIKDVAIDGQVRRAETYKSVRVDKVPWRRESLPAGRFAILGT